MFRLNVTKHHCLVSLNWPPWTLCSEVAQHKHCSLVSGWYTLSYSMSVHSTVDNALGCCLDHDMLITYRGQELLDCRCESLPTITDWTTGVELHHLQQGTGLQVLKNTTYSKGTGPLVLKNTAYSCWLMVIQHTCWESLQEYCYCNGT